MDAQSVIVEWRPLLQVCQFYIKSRFYSEDTKIGVEANCVKIVTNSLELEIVMPESVQLLKDSLSGLCFSQDSLLFRTQSVPPKNKGSFKAEMCTPINPSSKIEIFKPKLEIDQETHIFCIFCSYKLTQELVKFTKILPLPENFDSGDFFCHGKMDVSLDPKKDNLFYGPYFYNIHPSTISFDETIKDLIVCKNCLSWLGNRDEKHVQLWNSTSYFSTEPQQANDVALKDFLNLIKKATNEFISNNKLVIQCDIGNGETHYLLLWIMDKKLNLLSTHEKIVSGKMTLAENQVTKLLYSYQTSETELVTKWYNLTNTNRLKVSRIMLQKGMDHLQEMSNQIPQEFRVSQNMNISFLAIAE